MENIRKIFLEQIEPYTDTFNNLSICLTNSNVLADVLLALQKITPLYTRTNTRQFLSHYISLLFISKFFFRLPITLPGLPTTIEYGGILLEMTAPAEITEPLPT